jgi:hypothetical protein
MGGKGENVNCQFTLSYPIAQLDFGAPKGNICCAEVYYAVRGVLVLVTDVHDYRGRI